MLLCKPRKVLIRSLPRCEVVYPVECTIYEHGDSFVAMIPEIDLRVESKSLDTTAWMVKESLSTSFECMQKKQPSTPSLKRRAKFLRRHLKRI